jgi:superfamily I DNA/RNA helicase
MNTQDNNKIDNKTGLTVFCPACKSPMIKRSGKYGYFYGCSNYPTCKGILNLKQAETQNPNICKPIVEKTVLTETEKETNNKKNWSNFQTQIFDLFSKFTHNILIQAVAGSGKSTTLKEIARIAKELNPTWDIIYLAFNKDIVDEISPNMPLGVSVKTLNSQGLYNCKINNPRLIVEIKKLDNIFKLYSANCLDCEILKPNQSVIIRLVNLIKDSMLDLSLESISYLTERYGLTLNGDTQVIYNAIAFIYNESVSNKNIVDFNDMIYNNLFIPCKRYDLILIDETQDLNILQQAVLKNWVKSSGLMVFVGDRYQSIYGFRAADSMAMDHIKESFNCVELPLSVSYRCTKETEKLIKEKFTDINFSVPESAKTGKVEYLKSESQMIETIQTGDIVLCRNNAPLVKPCYKLIASGIKAVILGREIGDYIVSFINRISRKYNCVTLGDLSESLELYASEESDKLLKINSLQKLEKLIDDIETVKALMDCEDIRTINDIFEKINDIFSDNNGSVTLSTIHKVKGKQYNNVYLLYPELLPSKNAIQDWAIQQENNLLYVALTRNLDSMYFVPKTKK